MRTAYLVIFVNTRTLLVKEAGIYSEGARTLSFTLSQRHCAADMLSAEGRDYEEAKHNLVRTLRNSPHLTWVFNLLPESDKVPPRKSIPP